MREGSRSMSMSILQESRTLANLRVSAGRPQSMVQMVKTLRKQIDRRTKNRSGLERKLQLSRFLKISNHLESGQEGGSAARPPQR